MIDVKKVTELFENLANAIKNNKEAEWVNALNEMLRFYLDAVNDAINPIIPPVVPFLCAALRYSAQVLEEDHNAEGLTAELMALLKENSTRVVIPIRKGSFFAEGGEEE